jgi:hypothetical protein
MSKLAIAAAAALLLTVGAAQARPNGPATTNTVETNALASNGLDPNGVEMNGIKVNGLASTGLTSEGISLGELSGVQVEAVILPDLRR